MNHNIQFSQTCHISFYNFVQIDPSYRPSSMICRTNSRVILPFAGSDKVLTLSQWNLHVVGKISSWIDLDSEDEILRKASEFALKQEIERGSYLSLRACVLPTPKRASCANYARCVNEILQNLKHMKLWLRIPLKKFDDDPKDANSNQMVGMADSWEMWNSFRRLCEYHNKLAIVLDATGTLPSANSIGRWIGEPVKAAIIHTNTFTTNNKGPYLSRRRQNLAIDMFSHSMQVIISGKLDLKALSETYNKTSANDIPKHPFKSYLDSLSLLYQRMDPHAGIELCEFGEKDYLQEHSQPLLDNLQSLAYEELEKNEAKYNQYRLAISQALINRISDKDAPVNVAVVIVVGAGRGLLVRAAFKAARETRRRVRIYAVEKNPNAVISLDNMIKNEDLENYVHVVCCDIRSWSTDDKADILVGMPIILTYKFFSDCVSDFLGSFGDDELSPECLDAAQKFLKDDGMLIPCACTSYLQPVTTSRVYNRIKLDKKSQFETPYNVKLYTVARVAPSKRVFTFIHPNNLSTSKTNERYTKIQFKIPPETGAALVHGFAGYFEAILYQDIRICTEPSRITPRILGWFPLYFPLTEPVYVASGVPLELDFWRCCDQTKVWYEWSVTSPTLSHVHNSCGDSYSVNL
ncbi:protein arginine N-methyltransferase 1.5-like [Impatiens glandulifera]|uniref:protein arginine N-methyltransferase 1.5-like n=1 Tax=Impatiens glandulifera TaxID=253017 RepID=UPI001FB0EC3E|nr:protein arginine N-methyltransferase 1.5-like [Impatiens glandulifera]